MNRQSSKQNRINNSIAMKFIIVALSLLAAVMAQAQKADDVKV